jgi:hypothetical protein
MGVDGLISPLIAFDWADSERAWKEWGCNCGPAALAATLGWSLDRVRPHLGDFDAKRHMSPTMMLKAVAAAGFVHRPGEGWPVHGLVRIQWGGPWLKPGVPPRVAYGYTHWIAAKYLRDAGEWWVFDVNGGWMFQVDWIQKIVPAITSTIKRADGEWSTTHRWEVRKAIASA